MGFYGVVIGFLWGFYRVLRGFYRVLRGCYRVLRGFRGPEGLPPLCCRKGHESLRICIREGSDFEGLQKPRKRKELYFSFICLAALDRFLANVGAKTPLNGSGSTNGPEGTYNWPRRPTIRPCRC